MRACAQHWESRKSWRTGAAAGGKIEDEKRTETEYTNKTFSVGLNHAWLFCTQGTNIILHCPKSWKAGRAEGELRERGSLEKEGRGERRGGPMIITLFLITLAVAHGMRSFGTAVKAL